jgi:hypothetical protein
MTVDEIYINGCLETTFLYDSYDDDFDVKHADIFIRELTGKIIDNLSKDGIVDVDVTYGHLDQHKFQDYTIEFFVNDHYKGFMQITVCYD